jgi:hypothetical protein
MTRTFSLAVSLARATDAEAIVGLGRGIKPGDTNKDICV